MPSTPAHRLAAACLALAAGAALAQSDRTGTASNPTGVGVSSGTAQQANEQAVPRSDTGTVTRTGPTLGERARDAKDAVVDKAGDIKDATVEKAGNAKDAVVDKSRDAKNAVVDKSRDAKNAVTRSDAGDRSSGAQGERPERAARADRG